MYCGFSTGCASEVALVPHIGSFIAFPFDGFLDGVLLVGGILVADTSGSEIQHGLELS